MNELLKDITDYMEYLIQTCQWSVSVHFSDEILNNIPEWMFTRLLPYNIHRNPYCVLVKKEHWQVCMAEQKRIMKEEFLGPDFCRTCHAGVAEYIHIIKKENRILGYVAVSGYRGTKEVSGCIDLKIWKRYLKKENLCDASFHTLTAPLCRMLETLLSGPMQEAGGDEYKRILQFIHEHHGCVTLDGLCSRFARSKSHISHLFRKKCGMTLCSYCNQVKLEYAKKRLDNTTASVTETAMDAGFNDVSYFIRMFKDKYGMTPFKYKEQMHGRRQMRQQTSDKPEEIHHSGA